MPSVTALPAVRGAAMLALGILDEARDAAKRLERKDPEGVHDFRVALRRLHTHLRTYRRIFPDGVMPKSVVRRVKKLFIRTDALRNYEVQAAWLRERLDGTGKHERLAMLSTEKRLEDDAPGFGRRKRRKMFRRFERLERKLRRRLSAPAASGPRDARSFREAAAERILGQARETSRSLAGVRGLHSVRSMHRARIEAKRLRYLLEPFASDDERVESAIGTLKRLQDLLGDVHDRDLLLERLHEDEGAAHLRGVIDAERDALFRRFRADWSGPSRLEALRHALSPTIGRS
ncbi:MAG: CHAD domain-containing protein [Elusimicrobia bacterium]|nr:CHAD domain-containing protein [Elusimicrobiota bacterium]